MMYKFRQGVLNGQLSMANFCNVRFKAANSPIEYSVTDSRMHKEVIFTLAQLLL